MLYALWRPQAARGCMLPRVLRVFIRGAHTAHSPGLAPKPPRIFELEPGAPSWIVVAGRVSVRGRYKILHAPMCCECCCWVPSAKSASFDNCVRDLPTTPLWPPLSKWSQSTAACWCIATNFAGGGVVSSFPFRVACSHPLPRSPSPTHTSRVRRWIWGGVCGSSARGWHETSRRRNLFVVFSFLVCCTPRIFLGRCQGRARGWLQRVNLGLACRNTHSFPLDVVTRDGACCFSLVVVVVCKRVCRAPAERGPICYDMCCM
jgi:hypothetical protein